MNFWRLRIHSGNVIGGKIFISLRRCQNLVLGRIYKTLCELCNFILFFLLDNFIVELSFNHTVITLQLY